MYQPKDPDWAKVVQEIGMGDRFYTQQKEGKRTVDGKKKAPRKLKAEWVNEVNEMFSSPVLGLDKLTIDSLADLYTKVKEK